METDPARRCGLALATGVAESCTPGRCVFWQPGADDLEGGCAVERLGLHRLGEDVAVFLLDVRERLASPSTFG